MNLLVLKNLHEQEGLPAQQPKKYQSMVYEFPPMGILELNHYEMRRKAPGFRHGDKRRFVQSTKRVDIRTAYETLTA